MRRLLALAAMLLAAALPAKAAEDVVLDLSQDSVSISTNFDGSDLLIYGAVKREDAIPDDSTLDVVITVEGPYVPLTVYRKARVLGVWVNTDAVEVDLAPSFYAVATTRPFGEVLSNVEDLRHHVSIPRAIRSVGAPVEVENAQVFTDAVIRIREAGGQYRLNDGAVSVREQTLFSTRVQLPANLTEGTYQTRIFLTREGRVVGQMARDIEVRKIGLGRWLYNLSQGQPLLYGLLAVVIALVAGWTASAVTQLLRS
ncbi:Putative transmembrane protein [Roseivivax sp. THAF40]|nr:Putative transmembrane protein [Roseivivax sp. THAF197b]QFT47942.1 Putative transmembrane protein [Roseivivax sp. THAF40]